MNEFANDESHVNGIGSFRSFAERRLQKFNGAPAETSRLHLNVSQVKRLAGSDARGQAKFVESLFGIAA